MYGCGNPKYPESKVDETDFAQFDILQKYVLKQEDRKKAILEKE